MAAENGKKPRVSSVEIGNFRPRVKNSLFGFIDVTLPSGLTVCGVTLHRKDGSRWCGMPAREYLEDDGAKGWLPVVKFVSRHIADRFRDEVFAAFDDMEAAKTPQKPQTPSGVPKAKIPW